MDNLDKYLPAFEEDAVRAKLADLDVVELTEMLIYAYKEKRVLAKVLDAEHRRLKRIEKIVTEPSSLVSAPGVPTAEDLRRMMEDDPPIS